MKLGKLPLLLGTIFIISAMGSVNVHAATRSYLSKEYDTPEGTTMFTDVWSYNSSYYNLKDAEDRTSINGSGAAKIDKWKSDIEYVREAPELQIYFEGAVPPNTEFEVRLTNLKWFFRNSGADPALSITTYGLDGGLELLYPTTYNKYIAKYIPDDYSGLSGEYIREANNEVAYRLIISEGNESVAKVVLLNGANSYETLRIPLVTLLTNYADAKVEIVPTTSSSISPGIHTVLKADRKISTAKQPSTTTTVPSPMSGINEVSVPEILITENLFGIIENGAIILTAPEGYAILPDVNQDKLKKLDLRTLNIKDDAGNYVVNVSLGGGLKWKNLRSELFQQNPVREVDLKLYHSYPPGGIDPSRLIIEFKNLVKSTDRSPGSVSITGLKIVKTGDEYAPGDLYLNISPYFGNRDIVSEDFVVGIIDSGYSSSDYMNSFNIINMTLSDLIKSPEFKAKTYIHHSNGNLQPAANLTRGQLCDMLYLLLADTTQSYIHSFSDVKGNIHENAIAFCAEQGYVNGYGDGKFLPNGNIKRGEFAVVLNKIIKLNANANIEFANKDHFAYEAIKQLVHAQIMQGYGGNELGQDNLINKQEAVAMLNRAFNRGTLFTPSGLIYNDVDSSHWAYGDMMNAACGYITN